MHIRKIFFSTNTRNQITLGNALNDQSGQDNEIARESLSSLEHIPDDHTVSSPASDSVGQRSSFSTLHFVFDSRQKT